MKRNAITTRARVRALTDPEPKFVSIVKAGANQVPFLTVKLDPSALKENDIMSLKTALAAKGHDIAVLNFSSDKFDSEAAVQKWLEEGGYTDVTVEKTDAGFTVVNKTTEFDGEPEEIDTDFAGVSVLVGKVAGAEVEADDEDTETEVDGGSAVKTVDDEPAVVRKGEEDGEETPAEETIIEDETAEDAAKSEDAPEEDADAEKASAEKSEDTPEGEQRPEPTDEDVEVAKSIIAETSRKGLYDVMNLAELVAHCRWVVSDFEYSGMPEDVMTALKGAGQALLDVMAGAMEMTVEELTEVFREARDTAEKGQGIVTVTDVETETISTSEEDKVEADAETAEKADAEADADADAEKTQPADDEVAALKAQVEALTAKIDELTAADEADDGEGDASTTAERAEEQDDGREDIARSRNGADIDEDDEGSEEDAKRAAARKSSENLRIRGFLGRSKPLR